MELATSTAAPVVNLPRLDLTIHPRALEPGSPEWSSSCRSVREALETHGWFLLVGYDNISQELRQGMLTLMKDLFNLPAETKSKNTSPHPINAYSIHIDPNELIPTLETLAAMNMNDPNAARSFTDLMWPEGNDDFCKTINSMSKEMLQLAGVMMKMIFESYGVVSYYESLMESSESYFRMTKYSAPMKDEKTPRLVPHTDINYLTLLSQNEVDGLQIKSNGGEWVEIIHEKQASSVVVMAGQTLRAWSNGRIYAPLHDVLVAGENNRMTCAFFLFPKENHIVETQGELIDEDHPPLFKPFSYLDFRRYASDKYKGENILQLYAGV